MIKIKENRPMQARIKLNIIKCILEENEPISEPDIRKKLEEKNIVKDQSTINRYLHDLNNLELIELIKPIKKGMSNKWDITKIEHLKKIKMQSEYNKPLEKIELNSYEKSIMIILWESNTTIDDLIGFFSFIWLRLSPSLFNECLDVSIQDLFKRAYENYQREEEIKNSINIIKTRSIDDHLKSNQLCPYLEMSNLDEVNPTLKKEIFIRVAYGTGKTHLMLIHAHQIIKILSLDWLLQHFLDHDILGGVASPEEQEFVEKTKLNHIKSFLYFKDANDPILTLDDYKLYNEFLLRDLNQASAIMTKYKQPSILDKQIYDSPEKIYKVLRKIYKP